MSQQRTFKKGEFLVKEGQKATYLYLITSGLVSVCVVRDKKFIELFRVSSGQIIGEEVFTPSAAIAYVVVAVNETKVFDVPIAAMEQEINACKAVMKLFIKGVLEKQKALTAELRILKLESNSAPCPPEHVAKIFGVIFHAAGSIGTKKDNKLIVPWSAFKKYAQRVFLESPVRLEQAMNVLVKLKVAEKQMVKNDTDPTAPEELGFFHINDLGIVERFFDFYQNYFFKPGYEGILKYDEKCMQTAKALLKISENHPVDRNGTVTLKFLEAMDQMKAELGGTFNVDALGRLQQKGLFVKRQTSSDGGTLSFLRTDFSSMVQSWAFLKEIDRWNELGFVDLSNPEEKKAAPSIGGDVVCPSCKATNGANQKFCGECGFRLQ